MVKPKYKVELTEEQVRTLLNFINYGTRDQQALSGAYTHDGMMSYTSKEDKADGLRIIAGIKQEVADAAGLVMAVKAQVKTQGLDV